MAACYALVDSYVVGPSYPDALLYPPSDDAPAGARKGTQTVLVADGLYPYSAVRTIG